MQSKSVAIISGNHLCHNPRVLKEAIALTDAGYDVEVFGAWFNTKLKARDEVLLQNLHVRFHPVVDFTKGTFPVALIAQLNRVRNRLGSITYQYAGFANRWQFGYARSELSARTRSLRTDLNIVHLETGLWVGMEMLRSGARVGVDMEDWFSEDLLDVARRSRPVGLLRDFEASLLRHGVHSACPSHAMSHALAVEFGCRPPCVVYNAFPWSDRHALKGEMVDRNDRGIPSVHWYSQTIGPGRGLEDLFAALPHLAQPLEVHLRGNPVARFQEWLDGQVPSGWHDRVFVHPIVNNDQLLSRIAEHDIGFAGEIPYCRNKDLTVSNKLLHYLLAGLAVVASDTRGQREVAEAARAVAGAEPVLLYPSGDPLALAARIDQLLSSPGRLAQAKAAALTAAERTFCWERQVPVLLESVQAALAIP